MSKIFKTKNMIQKIGIVLLITIVCYIMVPTYSSASFGGDMMKVLVDLVAGLGDVFSGAMNHFMLGTEKMVGSVMLEQDDPTVTEEGGALNVDNNANPDIILDQKKEEEKIDEGLFDSGDWKIPNLLYSPEAIFSNNVAALDVNFLRPNTYTSVQDADKADEHAKSAAQVLSKQIGDWYVSFRNIAIVALLTVLLYIGIRIVISSTAADKAKYRENLRDWLIAICLVFVMHFIMSGILMITQQVTNLFSEDASEIVVEVDGLKFKESLMGVARLRAQSADAGTAATFCIMYIMLVVATLMFTFIYLKRFLYMAFLTMIAPLVAITYPIDKLGDGKAQAFNMWFKEYLMNALLQPIHLILYTALISTATELVNKNFIYAIVAVYFLIPAEKFIKKMFGFNKAETPSEFGAAAAATTMMAMGTMKSLANVKKPKTQGKDNAKIRTANNSDKLGISDNTKYDGLDTVNFDNNQEKQKDDFLNGKENNINQQSNEGVSEENNSGQPQNSGSQYQNSQKEEFDAQQDAAKGQKINTSKGEDDNKQKEQEDGRAHLIPGYDINEYVGQQQTRREKFKNSPITKTAIRGVKSGAKSVWKNKRKIITGAGSVALGVTGGIVGAASGFAIGAMSGDMKNAFTYGAVGATSGSLIGKNTVKGAEALYDGTAGMVKGGVNGAGQVRDVYEQEKYGYAEAAKRKQQRSYDKAKKEFLKDKEQIEQAKLTQMELEKKGISASEEDIMSSRFDYVSAGIKEGDIQRAQIAEARSGGINGSSHGNYVSIAQEADRLGISKSTFSDTKKYDEFHDTIAAQLGESGANRAMGMMAEMKGAKIAHNNQQKRRAAAKTEKKAKK